MAVKRSEVLRERAEFASKTGAGDVLVCGLDRFEENEIYPFMLAIAEEKPHKATKKYGLAEGAAKEIECGQWCVRLRCWLVPSKEPLTCAKFETESFVDLPGWESNLSLRAPRLLSLDALHLTKITPEKIEGDAYFLSNSDLAFLLRKNYSGYNTMMGRK